MRTAFFLDTPAGPCFALAHRPPDARGAVLLVPPFAEELNKSRRMLTLAGEALAAAGLASLLPDLQGTGDSAGDFADARWTHWLADLDRAAAWLDTQSLPLAGILALRGGALLAADWLATREHAIPKLLLWQPVLSGETWLTQFLRLRSAAAKFAGRDEPVKALRQRLAQGETLEVAGYGLAPELAAALDAQRLSGWRPGPGMAVAVFETAGESGGPGPAAQQLAQAWPSVTWDARCFAGDSYWTSQEISAVPELVAASAAFFAGEQA
ncbi:MAG: hydrolase 2, exosortase A system-associated [Gammaproteobacteria bacterium]|nr:hydrolase 2, exosortase A system-associated [Gammaproteobacteria bacterium]